MNISYILTSKMGDIILSDLSDDDIIQSALLCKTNVERCFCDKHKMYRRQGLIELNNYNLYIISYNDKITNRIFSFYREAAITLGDFINSKLVKHQESQDSKFRRLQHNLINHNSLILQHLYSLIPQGEFKNNKSHVNIVQGILENNPRDAAYTYLKVLKGANLIKAEFEVYSLLDDDNPELEFSIHSAHKLILLTLAPFWVELKEKNIEIIIGECHDNVYADYRTISVVLCHIFDNISKYCSPHSQLSIEFNDSTDFISITFDMISLKVEKNEQTDIFLENVSGINANKLNLNGDGIGMYMVKKLIELNKGQVEFIIGSNDTSISLDGISYEKNMLIVNLRKEI